MKLTIDADTLKDGLSVLGRAVPRSLWDGFLFTGENNVLRLNAYGEDLWAQVTLDCDVTGPWQTTLPRKIDLSACHGPVTLTLEDDGGKVRAEATDVNFELNTTSHNPENFALTSEVPTDWCDLPGTVTKILYVAKDQKRLEQNVVQIEEDFLMCRDFFVSRMAWQQLDHIVYDGQILANIEYLGRAIGRQSDNVKIAPANGKIWIRNENLLVNFPDSAIELAELRHLVTGVEAAAWFRADKSELLEKARAVSRLSVSSMKPNGPMRLTLHGYGVKLEAIGNERCSGAVSVSVEESAGEVVTGVASKYLVQALGGYRADTVTVEFWPRPQDTYYNVVLRDEDISHFMGPTGMGGWDD